MQTFVLGLSVHATMQLGVLTLGRQTPLGAMMVGATQTRSGACFWQVDGCAKCGRRLCSSSRRVVGVSGILFIPCWILGDGGTCKVQRLVADGLVSEGLHGDSILPACGRDGSETDILVTLRGALWNLLRVGCAEGCSPRLAVGMVRESATDLHELGQPGNRLLSCRRPSLLRR